MLAAEVERRDTCVAQPDDVCPLDLEVVEESTHLGDARSDVDRLVDALGALVEDDAVGAGKGPQLLRVDDLEARG